MYSVEEVKALCSKVRPRKGNVGLLYMGGKGSLAKTLVSFMPSADVFVDCFGGGGSVALEALRSGKYSRVIYNEIEPLVYDAFRSAVTGEALSTELPFISKEEFFSNNVGRDRACFSWNGYFWKYAYQERHIHYLDALHNYLMHGDLRGIKSVLPDIVLPLEVLLECKTSSDVMRTVTQRLVSDYLGTRGEFGASWKLGTTSFRLLHLERFNRIKNTRALCVSEGEARVECFLGSYDNVLSKVKTYETVVVYCDPPYKDTYGYNDNVFDYDAFERWFKELNVPAYLSEKEEFPYLDVVWEGSNQGRLNYISKHFTEYLYKNRYA